MLQLHKKSQKMYCNIALKYQLLQKMLSVVVTIIFTQEMSLFRMLQLVNILWKLKMFSNTFCFGNKVVHYQIRCSTVDTTTLWLTKSYILIRCLETSYQITSLSVWLRV